MKLTRIITPQILVLLSCYHIIAQEYSIEVKIKGAENAKAQLAYYQSEQQLVVQNSKFDNKGKVTFSGKEKLKPGIYMIIFNNNFFDILIRDEYFFKLKTDTNNMVLNMQVSGSEENKIFYDYQKKLFNKKNKIENIEKKIEELKAQNDSATEEKQELEKLTEQLIQIPEDLQKEHPNSYIAKILKAMEITDSDKFNFADEELLRTPFYYNMVRRFIKKNIERHYQNIIYETKKMLSYTKQSQDNYQFIATYLLNFYNTFYKTGMNRVFIFIADNYFLNTKKHWFTEEQLAEVQKRRDFLAQSTPEHKAPDLTLESISGEYFSLLQVDAQYTLLYFWSSGCGHCTKATEILKKNYDDLQKKGIEIFAVCLDHNKDQWLKKVNELQTPWINCYVPDESSNFRDKYYVYGSPLLFLIDKHKIIKAVRNGENEIEHLVNEFIKSE